MIVAMSRVLVIGPKRLLAAVLEETQQVGALHVDRIEAEEVPAVAPTADEHREEREALERLRLRVDGLLGLLPGAAEEALPSTAEVAGRPVDALEAEVAAIEAEVQALVRARLEAQDELELIRSYESAVRVLAPLLGALSGSRAFETVGFILRTRDLALVQDFRRRLEELTEGRVGVVSRVVEEGKVGVVVAFLRRDEEAVRSFLARAGVSELRLPSQYADRPPAEAIRVMEERRRVLPQELARLQGELAAAARRHRPRLVAIRAVLQDRLARLQVVPALAQSRYTFILHGWAPTRLVATIRQRLRRRFGEEVVVYDSPADPHEAERVPVLLDNPTPIRPFQLLLGLFPPPRYGTWDPSPLIAVTFPIFVGLVIGDVGYGALFFLFGWWLRNRSRAGRAWTVPVLDVRLDPPLLWAVSWLVRVIAVWVIAFGVVYGEVFGNLPELYAHARGIAFHPLFDRVHEPGTTLYFRAILLFGVVMVYLGLVGHLVMALRHRHLEGVFESLVLIGASGALLLFLGTQAQMLPAALAPWSLYLLLAAVGSVVAFGVASRRPRGMAAGLLWFLESFTAFGHILSHARLMAFGLAAAALAIAANQLGPEMVAQFGLPGIVGAVVATLLAGLFQVLFFLFTIIGHLIQPARLHWIEFLTKVKYHDETGRPYEPLRSAASPRS
ncbi:MAG: V-type ATPase 116kDa subunit family protein [Armatimonadota bacterium]|nr:V-type ATPase 116kDa subunit family protein [Armatimonadota bacterium]MDR7479951.1 V-type ATPase 116kDa subunit family protein [Armatimonadota bacterium]MDR7488139.1 V-type ATPase 116kDa subunit family protein [Armatimonadota bacterium]MDR7490465.1 V-type ATPase 116kDa subunit family protein [Armatimonadota bacterium]MDR7501955.1 V-type ATPase 116kDa subunit family protein [Armatimonadota bacterium]